MLTAEPVANSQLPETLIPPLIAPVMEDPVAQVMLKAMKVPVWVMALPMVRDPLIMVLPDEVSNALLPEVPLIVNEAPELTVRLLQTPETPESIGWFAGADGMVTLSLAAGAPAGDQLVDVFQAVLVAPVQTFCPDTVVEKIITRIAMKKDLIFIGL